eukprot:2659095-Prymnesium_polylepis.1
MFPGVRGLGGVVGGGGCRGGGGTLGGFAGGAGGGLGGFGAFGGKMALQASRAVAALLTSPDRAIFEHSHERYSETRAYTPG